MKKAVFIGLGLIISGCMTKGDLKREEEIEKLRQDVSSAKSNRVDFEVMFEETKNEVSRLSNAVGETTDLHRRDVEEIRKEIQALTVRLQALEQRAVQEELAQKQPAPPPAPDVPKNLEAGKKLLDEGKFEEAAEVFQIVTKGSGPEARKSHFYLGEAYFGKKDYASAALEYNEFRKRSPKDPLLPNAIFRQSLAFKAMGKSSEAKLFFQDLIDRYPKSPFATKAKAELKKLK